VRLRTTAENSQQSDTIAVESYRDSAYSPATALRTYELAFRPPATSPRFRLQFDYLNVEPLDNPTTDLFLDEVAIKRVVESEFASATLEAHWDFEQWEDGWVFSAVPTVFAEPEARWDPPVDDRDGRLVTHVVAASGFEFGFWGSQLSIRPVAEHDRLCYAVFTVGTNLTDRTLVPTFRCRINDDKFRLAQLCAVASTGSGENAPVAGEPRDYVVFFRAESGSSMIFSFDVTTDPTRDGDAVDAELYLYKVEVYSVPWE